jgi:hypothetical protein
MAFFIEPGQAAFRRHRLLVIAGLDPAIHLSRNAFHVMDTRVIGERKRCRSSNGYARV